MERFFTNLGKSVTVLLALFLFGWVLLSIGQLFSRKGSEEIDTAVIHKSVTSRTSTHTQTSTAVSTPARVVVKKSSITPVMVHDSDSEWNPVRKVFVKSDGSYFITPPRFFMWDGDRGNPYWAVPFDEFFQTHREEAEQILQRQQWSTVYYRWDAVVQKYGMQALPPPQYRR